MKKYVLIFVLMAAASPLFALKFSAVSFFNAKEDASKQNPTFFYQDSDIHLFDGGKKILLGFSGSADAKRKSAMYYSDAGKLARLEKTVPIDSFFASRPDLLLNNVSISKSPNSSYPFTIKKIVNYDESTGTASLVVQNLAKNAKYDLTAFRFSIVNWNLKENKITSAYIFADGLETVTEHYSPVSSRSNLTVTSNIIYETFYDSAKKKGYICYKRESRKLDAAGKAPKESSVSLVIAECTESGVTEIFSQLMPGRAPDRFFYDQATSTILAVVYTETGASGNAYLINLADKKAKQIQTPLTTYGAVFDPDGIRLYMLSNKTGNIRVYNLKTDKVMQEYYAGKVAWRIGFVRKDELAFFNKDGIQIISAKGSLKTVSRMSPAQYISGQKTYNYPQGGLITEGNIYIGWNGTIFHVKYE